MRSTVALALLLSALGAVGCGTSQVLTDDSTARIWANGQMIGKGHGEIQQYGMPETTTILVKAEDGRQQTTTVKRKITGTTVLGALITYGTCLIFCWSYPDTIWANLPARAASPFGASGEAGGVDPWLQPPPGWQPRPSAVPAAAGTPAAGTPAAGTPAPAGTNAPAATPRPAPSPAPRVPPPNPS